MTSKEFSLIARYFSRIKMSRHDVEIGIGDDCALLKTDSKQMLAISTDTLVCGRHFLPDIKPADLAYKAVATNISDLAAIGAEPAWITLALTLPEIDEIWLEEFSDTLFDQLNYYNIDLIGGDTTAGQLSITSTIHGFVPIGKELRRSGAKLGDWIYVTGTLGDSAAGLAILKNQLKIEDSNDAEYLVKRHLRPTPRILHGQALRGYASSAIDLSDGLISDLKHIMKASNTGAILNINSFPISNVMNKHIDYEQTINWILSGGEDYELLFTASELNNKSLNVILSDLGVMFTCIGQIQSRNKGLQFVQNGIPITLNWTEYDHFTY